MSPNEFQSSAARELDTAERLVRVETKLDFVISRMETMPPSPTCLQKHTDFEERFTLLERWHNMTMGALVVANLVFIFFSDKLKGLF